MGRLSITAAWNEASEILKRDFGALFTVALAFLLLPNLAMQALGPGPLAPGETPQPGLWMLIVPVAIVLNIAGSIAISTLALGKERVVGNAIAHGFRRVLPMLGATILVALAAVILCIPVVLLTGIDLQDLVSLTPAVLGRALLAMLFLLVVLIAFAVRLILITPVAAAEPVGPIGILKRSWELTRGHFWKLLGFLLLIGIVVLIIGMTTASVFGLAVTAVAGAPEPGDASWLVLLLLGGLVNAALTVGFTTLIARVYLQLAAGGIPEARAETPAGTRPPATVRREADRTPD